jgi:hypothetical protein
MSWHHHNLRRSLDADRRAFIPSAVAALVAHLLQYPSRDTVTDVMHALRDAGFSAPGGRGWFEGYLEASGFRLETGRQRGGGVETHVRIPSNEDRRGPVQRLLDAQEMLEPSNAWLGLRKAGGE